ncbi:MAG: BatA domain-containing protein [Planctomycetota bacterium]|nr:BatA domain-containing protein [Planctomycetota bacterium]
MNAINPFWSLWFPLAMAGLAVPVLIHLLSRYRSRQMDWAAMELLKRALVVRSKRLRLEDILLLLLRCLAAVLIALSLARPYISQAGSSGGGDGSSGVLIALDGSFSMSYKPGQISRFKDAVKRVQDVLATVKPGSPVTLAVMGSRAHVLVRDKAYEPEAFKEELSRLAPLPEALNLEACLGDIDKMVHETKAASHECFIVTDAQTVTWAKVPEAVNVRLQSLREVCRLFLLPVGTAEAENVAITRLSVGSGVLRANTTAMYIAEVANKGTKEVRGVTVQLFLSGPGLESSATRPGAPAAARTTVATDSLGVLKDQRVVDKINAGETVSVWLSVRLEKPGQYILSARITQGQGIAGDGLALDDVRHAVADVRGGINVLCVDGDPSTEPFKGETDFLAAALSSQGPSGEAAGGGSGLTVETVQAGNFEASRLSNYDVVFLANVPELDKFRLMALDEYVRRGGGLVVFLGDKIIPATINSQWTGHNGVPLLPAKIGDRRQKAAEDKAKDKASAADRPVVRETDRAGGDKGGSIEGWPLDTDIPYSPITGVLGRLRRESWTGIRFREYFKVTPLAGAQTLLRIAPSTDPLLVERTLGRGRVLLCTTSANRKWTDLVVYPAYLMMMQQAVTHLTRKAHEAPYLVAQRLVLDLPPEAPAKVTVSAGDPADTPVEVAKIDVSERDGQKVADAGPALRPGVYTVSWPQCPAPLKAAVNVDPRESDLAVLRGGKLADVASTLSLRLVGEKDDIQAAVRESRKGREIWFTLLMIALAALAAEAVLGKMFSRRMSHGSQGPSTVPGARL